MTLRRFVPAAAALVPALLLPAPALAGMPRPPELTDVAEMRLQVLSFFLAVFLAGAWVVQRLWNWLGRDFPSLPRLTYPKALGVSTLWGLLFVLVLTMISGARELMTPGAWERNGITYKLSEPTFSPEERMAHVRKQSLERLRTALWKYAETRKGQFPPHDFVTDIPEDVWKLPDPSGIRYVYVAGLKADQGAIPLAYEPGTFGGDRFALLTSGEIKKMSIREIQAALSESAGKGAP